MAATLPLSIVIRAIDKSTNVFKNVRSSAAAFDRTMHNIAKTGSTTGALGSGIVANSIKNLGLDVINTAATFQGYKTTLTTTLGDPSLAEKAMSQIKAFAASTPFTVDELTSAYIKLKNRGIEPTNETLRSMGDLAASQGKSFDQFTEAMLDAVGGEFERLKEFGIKGSKAGNQVSLAFKGVTKSVKNTPEAIQEALMSFGALDGVKGGMDALSKTWKGVTSNLEDSTDSLKVTFGTEMINLLQPLLGLLVNILGRVGVFFGDTENGAIRTRIALALLVPLVGVFLVAAFLSFAAMIYTQVVPALVAMSAALTANPIGLVVVGVVALIAAFALLVIYWKEINGWISKTWNEGSALTRGLMILAGVLVGPILAGLYMLAGAINFVADNYQSLIDLVKTGGSILYSIFVQPWVDGFNLVGAIIQRTISLVSSAISTISGIVPDWAKSAIMGASGAIGGGAASGEPVPVGKGTSSSYYSERNTTSVSRQETTLRFENLPEGAKVSTKKDPDISSGPAMVFG